MKTASTLMALLLAATTTWSMPLEERQNDVPDCIDGTTEEQIGPFQGKRVRNQRLSLTTP